jgi:nitrogen fixation protein FixH
MMAQKDGPVIRGKHVLLAMLGLFGIVIAVNAVFVTLAIGTFTGVTTANPYKEGLAYNQVLAARDAQRGLGWQGEVDLAQAAAGEDRIAVVLRDAAGSPLTGLQLSGSLRRPTHAGIDQPLAWQEAAPGRYEAAVALPERGNWDLLVSADAGGSQPFEMKARLWFK